MDMEKFVVEIENSSQKMVTIDFITISVDEKFRRKFKIQNCNGSCDEHCRRHNANGNCDDIGDERVYC